MLTVQKKIFSLAGMSPKSSNMAAKSGINTADTSKVYHLLVVGADALTMSEITVDDVSVEKVSGCAREFLVVDDLLCSRSDSTKTFIRARDVNEMSAMYCASGSSNSEFSESIKKSLPLCGNTVYGYKAPHKTGAGIGVLVNRMATYDAPSVFFYVVGLTHPFFGRWCIIQRLCQSMVAQAGASSERRYPFEPVTPTLSGLPPAKLAFPVVALHAIEWRLPHAGYYPYPKTAIYLDYRRSSPRLPDNYRQNSSYCC